MRKNFGAKPLSYPQPVFIIAAYDENGTPNAMNAAWGGISEMNEISLCLSNNHKTVKNILHSKAFTISMADAGHVTACDYVGLVSGNNVTDTESPVQPHYEEPHVKDFDGATFDPEEKKGAFDDVDVGTMEDVEAVMRRR